MFVEGVEMAFKLIDHVNFSQITMNSFGTFSDQDLISLMVAGDEAAFTEIFKRYNRLLFIHAHKMLKDKEAARDVELSRKQHLTHKEIGLRLDLSEKTVRNQVNNALRILRARFGWFSLLFFCLTEIFNFLLGHIWGACRLIHIVASISEVTDTLIF